LKQHPTSPEASPLNAASPSNDDLERLSTAKILARQPLPVLPPVPPVTRLPVMELSPEVFERLVLEYVWSVEAARDVYVYGRRGQKQYGLDIVGQDRDRNRFVYQVRRIATPTPSGIRAAVVDYAGPPCQDGTPSPSRRFNASRFVLAVAASIHDDTALVDETTALQDEYRNDLNIQVIGVEDLSVKLRDAVGIVAAFFGRDWARAFCGAEPPQIPPGQATGYGLLEGPLAELDLEAAATHAQQVRDTDPGVAAEVHRAIADQLETSGYPGHAEHYRHRAAEDMRRAGDSDGAFDLFWQLGLDGLLRGYTQTRVPELRSRTLALDDIRRAKLAVLRAAYDWYWQGSNLTATVPALRTLLEAGDPHALTLTTIVAEQAVVDGLYATDPPTPMVGPEDPPDNLAELTTELVSLGHAALSSPAAAASREWRARLRCALADATLERSRRAGEPASVDATYGPIVSDATAGRIPTGPAAMVHARAGRAHAAAGEPGQAIESWRRAVMAALPDFGGDAREAFMSMTQVVNSQGVWLIPDLGTISQAVPNRRTFLEAGYDPSTEALDNLRSGREASAFVGARRCVWETRLSGHLHSEKWARGLFADIMKATGRPQPELDNRIAAGEGKKAAAAAAALSHWHDLTEQLYHGSPWTVAAAAQALAGEADLVPDDEAGRIIGRLVSLSAGAATAPAIAGQPSREAFSALAAFAHRIESEQVDELVELIRPHMEQQTRLTAPAIAIVRGLYRTIPQRREQLAALIAAALDHLDRQPAWAAVRALREPDDPLEMIARDRAAAGDAEAIDALAQWQIDSPEVRAAARRAAAWLLRTPVGHPRHSWSSGGSLTTLAAIKVAVLIASGDQNDDLSPAALAAPASDQPTDESDPPDDAAIKAAGPVVPLAIGVTDKLLDMAADHHDMAISRVDAVEALAVLADVQPGSTSLNIARRLMTLAHDPRFGPQDDAELYGNDPLRGMRMNLGGRNLPSRALLTAAHAYQSAVAHDPTLADTDLAADIQQCGVSMLGSDDSADAENGARALAVLSKLIPLDPRRLADHQLGEVRAIAIHGWAAADGDPAELPAQLANDRDAQVRRRVAQFADTILTVLGPATADDIIEQLRADRAWSVRHRLAQAMSSVGGDN
jgi:hypothetical protein